MKRSERKIGLRGCGERNRTIGVTRHGAKVFSGTIGTRDEITVGNLVRRTRTRDDEDAGDEDAGPSGN